MRFAGAILIIAGTFATMLGFIGAINRSETCYVFPSFGGCDTYYQVALFAPLYPVSTVMIVLGAIIAISGVALTLATSTRHLSHTANRGNTPQLRL